MKRVLQDFSVGKQQENEELNRITAAGQDLTDEGGNYSYRPFYYTLFFNVDSTNLTSTFQVLLLQLQHKRHTGWRKAIS